MKIIRKTLKGWANVTNYMSSENVTNTVFANNLTAERDRLLSLGYKELKLNETLRGKCATEKIEIRGRYWRGNWSDSDNAVVTTFYK